MRLVPLLAAATLGGFLGSPLLAQIPRGATTRPAVALPRLMVSNPYAFATSDSVTAVTLGSAMRTRMDRVASGTYNVVSRDQMNQALHEFNYPADAILIPSVQRQFAVAVSARVLLSSSLARTESGRVTVTARLAGLNDDAGSVITVTQAAGQTLDDLGEKIADRFQPVVKANKDAKECIDRRNSDPKKANNAAQDAIRRSELSGLAWYCMAQVALDQQAPADSVISLLRKAADADPLSLPVLAQLARQYQAKGDTAKLVQTYQEMIVAAPTNEALIKEAFQQFLRAGRVDAARSAVEHAISLDEYNPELYDLLSNVCIFEENNRCAVDALEKLFTIDSTKADSTFFLKITAVASQPSDNPDTTRLIEWASRGVRKYPDNTTLQNQLLGAYALKGDADSMVAVAERLLDLDTTTVAPALLVANELVKQKRPKEALPLIDIIARRGTPQDRESAVVLLVNGALPLLQEPTDFPGAAELTRKALAIGPDTTSRGYVNASYVLGIADAFTITTMDPETEKAKSCDMARQEQQLVEEAFTAMTRGRSVNQAVADKYLPYLDSMKARTASMIKAYCR